MIGSPGYPTCWNLTLTLAILVGTTISVAQELVPGQGTQLKVVGDTFEDVSWEYVYNLPKSTRNLDNDVRVPTGIAGNNRWYEGVKRGQPDIIRRVPTPAGGLPGSYGALLLQSGQTGIPGKPSYEMQQDDFIADVHERVDGWIPVSRGPSAVVRVFLPRTAKLGKPQWTAFRFSCRSHTQYSINWVVLLWFAHQVTNILARIFHRF